MLFPLVIEGIQDVYNCIGDDTEFVIKKKGPFTYVNYKRMTSTTFPKLVSNGRESERDWNLTEEEWRMRRMRRELRGLVFDSTSGQVISRSMHKFFNINEREESSAEYIQRLISQNPAMQVTVMEKLDGSLTTAILVPVNSCESNESNESSGAAVNGENDESLASTSREKMMYQLRFRSKMGYENDHTDSLEHFLAISKQLDRIKYRWNESLSMYEMVTVVMDASGEGEDNDGDSSLSKSVMDLFRFCIDWMSRGYTCLFEFFSPENRIVINYDEPFLSLLAIRDNKTGVYVPFDEMIESARKYGVPHVKSIDCSEFSTNRDTLVRDLLEYCYKQEKIEGYVVRLTDMSNPSWTEMYKTKTKWYSDIHRVRELMALNNMSEHYVWALVIDNSVDDALPTLRNDEERRKLMEFGDALSEQISLLSQELQDHVTAAREVARVTEEEQTETTTYNMKLFAQYVRQVEQKRGATFAKCIFTAHKDLSHNPELSVEDLVCKYLKTMAQKSISQCQSLLGKTIQFYNETDQKKTKSSYVPRRRLKEQEAEQ